ncbi:hypothetical protein MMC07_001468 [Pseudocyphellaria aurata]|nr:hypothetical protein [Pseudocyphellaria aurata]
MTNPPTKICVFCSTGEGKSPAHLEAARSLARAMSDRSIHLIFGGGTTGMMGELAKTLVSLKGPDSVHGIITEGLIRFERAGAAVHMPEPLIESQYGRKVVVKDLHERKRMMAREIISGGPGSGFIGLSGGFGSMDELMEVVTWNQLGMHKTGVCLFNVEGFWDGVLSWQDHAIQAGFIRDEAQGILVGKETAKECLEWLKEYRWAGTDMNQKLEDA